MRALRVAVRVLLVVWRTVWWSVRAWPWLLVSLVVGQVLRLLGVLAGGGGMVALLLAGTGVVLLVPFGCLLAAVWATISPASFEQHVAAPSRRRRWCRRVRRDWPWLAERCKLTRTPAQGQVPDVPRLVRVRATGNTVTVRVRARAGQTVDDLCSASDAFATTQGAQAVQAVKVNPGVVEYRLAMLELLDRPRQAPAPSVIEAGAVTLGRLSDGTPWRLALASRHTLVVGRSGSGKGSVFWGIAGNLAPASHAGLVTLWGIDLKGGVEVAVGQGMFAHVAMDEQGAVQLLRDLAAVIAARQQVMRGQARAFTPTPGDPAHVLLIDELAVLTNYAARDVVAEASNLLKLILTQGRAFGVSVVAFVQDPKKDTVAMRDLFTQTLALRLASATETRMVLGDGMAPLAPAHHIAPTMPGCGFVVADDGSVVRVRADWWPDELIRWTARAYPAVVEAADPLVDPASLTDTECCQ